MTLALAFARDGIVGIIADRRISQGGAPTNDDYGKTGVVDWMNGRFAYAFAGTATLSDGSFDAQQWLVEALAETGAPDGDAELSIQRFAARASTDFANLKVCSADKRTTFIFVGIVRDSSGSMTPRVFWVSNFETLLGEAAERARPQFRVESESIAAGGGILLVLGSGRDAVIRSGGASGLVASLEGSWLHPRRVLDVGVRVIREASMDPRSANTVGHNCSSVIIGADPAMEVLGAYHIWGSGSVYYGPNYVCAAYDDRGAWYVARPRFVGMNGVGEPSLIVVGDVAPRAPCPCRSGLRYKHCHGSMRRPGVTEARFEFVHAMVKEPDHDLTFMSFLRSHDGLTEGMSYGSVRVSINGVRMIQTNPPH